MSLTELRRSLDLESAGQEIHALAAELYPACSSITGRGFRERLEILERIVPLQRTEVPSGTEVLDWTVPDEWNVDQAWIRGPDGRVVADVRDHGLHVMSYSVPFRGELALDELQPHLHSLPEHPDWIPYRTSYYEPRWGFCLPHRIRAQLGPGTYEVCMDTSLAPGSLSYAEHVSPGREEREVLLSVHACHPALANDNASGIAVAARLMALLDAVPHRHTYRLLVIPGTIGSIAWLARNEGRLERVAHGLVLTCLGDAGRPTYKRSRRGDAPVDRAAALVLSRRPGGAAIRDFDPYGYDERQYCSPGFDLPVGRLTRTPHGEFPEYHTSADDLDLLRPAALADSLDALLEILDVIERDGHYRNLAPRGEPQLGRRGVYPTIGGHSDPGEISRAILWVLSGSDGDQSLLDIAERSGMAFERIAEAADTLLAHALLERLDP